MVLAAQEGNKLREMTAEEKREAVKNYCGQRNQCYENKRDGDIRCPLFDVAPMGTECYWATDDDVIIKYYDMLVPYLTDDDDEIPFTVYEEPPENDPVTHPEHYTNGEMECIDEMILVFGKDAVKHFCVCNVWKYRYRAMNKGGREDLRKADYYILKYRELCE